MSDMNVVSGEELKDYRSTVGRSLFDHTPCSPKRQKLYWAFCANKSKRYSWMREDEHSDAAVKGRCDFQSHIPVIAHQHLPPNEIAYRTVIPDHSSQSLRHNCERENARLDAQNKNTSYCIYEFKNCPFAAIWKRRDKVSAYKLSQVKKTNCTHMKWDHRIQITCDAFAIPSTGKKPQEQVVIP